MEVVYVKADITEMKSQNLLEARLSLKRNKRVTVLQYY